jgi:hypothetical protein
MPASKELLLPPLEGAKEDDPVAWSLRLQALAELRALSQDFELPKPPIRLPEPSTKVPS